MQATVPVSGSISLGLPTSSLESRHLGPLRFHKQFLGIASSSLRRSRTSGRSNFVDSEYHHGTVFCPLPSCPFFPRLKLRLVRSQPEIRAFSSLFESGGKWWREKRPNGRSSRKALERLRTHRHRGRVLRTAAWIAVMLLMWASALYAQARAQIYMERNILPPLATIVSSHLGRQVELGKVERLSLLSVTLGPSSIGPHSEEFSCGEVPGLQIRLLPLRSIKRGQVVVDAVLRQPHALVAQKQDWSWLGIPTPAEKKVMKHSTETGIDARTKLKRVSREEMGARMSRERDLAARLAVKTGYTLGDTVESLHGKSQKIAPKAKSGSQGEDSKLEFTQAELDVDEENFSEQEQDGFGRRARTRRRENNPGIDDEEFEEPTLAMDVKRTVLRAKNWTDVKIMKPMKRKLLRNWSRCPSSPLTKREYQYRNLQRSSLAARAMFERIDRDKRQKMNSLRKGGPPNLEQGKSSVVVQQVGNSGLLASGKEREVGSTEGGLTNQDAATSRKGISMRTSLLEQTAMPATKGVGGGPFDELWGNIDAGDEGTGSGLTRRVQGLASRLVRQAKRRVDVSRANGWTPIALDAVYFRDGTFMLLAYGDEEAR